MSELNAPGPRQVLREMGIEARTIRVIQRRTNTHWLVDTADCRLVICRYAPAYSRQSIAYELDVLGFLAGREWPVPVPVAPLVIAGGAIWCASRYLPGRVSRPRTKTSMLAEQRRRGRLMARLHVDLAEFSSLGQREGFLPTDQGLFARDGRPPVDEVLQAYERDCPEQGSLLRRYADCARERLNRLRPDLPSPIAIHGDIVPWNIRYHKGNVSGLLDFEFTHLDLRVAEFVLAWRGHYDEVIRGYEEVSPLQPVERASIVPIYWAWVIACAVAEIEKGDHDLDWEMRHLLRSSSELFDPEC